MISRPWIFLASAIVFEVAATTSLKLSVGFTRLMPSIVVAVGYVASIFLLSQALVRGMQIGVAYAAWSAIGITLIAIVGAVLLGENLAWSQVGGIALVIAGVTALELGGERS